MRLKFNSDVDEAILRLSVSDKHAWEVFELFLRDEMMRLARSAANNVSNHNLQQQELGAFTVLEQLQGATGRMA